MYITIEAHVQAPGFFKDALKSFFEPKPTSAKSSLHKEFDTQVMSNKQVLEIFMMF